MKNWKTTTLAQLLIICAFAACTSTSTTNQPPTVGFIDGFNDSTIEQAKDGFLAALEEAGFSEKQKTLKLIYRNAQGDIPTMTQIVKYCIAQNVTLLATNPTLPTITALQNTKEIPVFMMVSPTPAQMKVEDAEGKAPANLFGVAETQDYIDTSFSLIPQLLNPKKQKLKVGLLYNQSEPQSVEAFQRMEKLAKSLNVELVALPVNATADAQLVTSALLHRDIDAFFANPDNTVFGAFETIIKSCNEAKVPVFTSEAGLVARGAVAAYGADIYQWGYQAGQQAAQFLKNKSTEGLKWGLVQKRVRVYNPEAAQRFGIVMPASYDRIKK